MKVSYDNTKEQYIELLLRGIDVNRKNKIKMWAIRILAIGIFVGLSIKKLTDDIDYYGYLRENSSVIILMYIICGILWAVVLPMVIFRIHSMAILKEVENMKLDFNGKVIINIDDKVTIESNYKSENYDIENLLGAQVKKNIVIITIKGREELIIPIESFGDIDNANNEIESLKLIIEGMKSVEMEEK